LQTNLATTCVVTAIRTADAYTSETTSSPTNIVISGTPLAPPTITGVTAANTTQLTVTFTNSANTTSTNAYLYSASTGGSALQSLTNQSSGFSFTNLNPSTTYYISLLAVGTGNYTNSAESARTSGTTPAVAAAPSVTVSPSSSTITLGQAVTFTATATSSDRGSLSYQWSFAGSPISGATSNQYSFTPGSVNQAGTYTVTVTNSSNGTTNTANASGSLTIVGPLYLTTPTTGLVGTFNSPFSLALAYGGGQSPVTFSLASGTLPKDVTLNSSTGVISGSPQTVGVFSLSVTATDANSQAVTSSFKLSINRATPTISFTISPDSHTTSATIFSSSVVPTTTSNSSGVNTYSISPGGTATDCAISDSSNIGVVSASTAGTCVIQVTNSGDSNYSLATSTATFTFLSSSAPRVAKPSVSISPITPTITLGTQETFTATASTTDGGLLSYNWYHSEVKISGATSSTYSFTSSDLSQAGAYRVVVTNTLNGTNETATATTSLTITTPTPPAPTPPVQIIPTPDPVQQSKITDISPSTTTAGNATPVVISGTFIEKISSIQINGVALPSGSWVQSSTTVSFSIPSRAPGVYQIQIYNGSSPVLKPITFTYTASIVVATPIPTPITKPKVTYIRCVKPGHGTRIAYGINPSCPAGYTKK
jgi:hypothetical protein